MATRTPRPRLIASTVILLFSTTLLGMSSAQERVAGETPRARGEIEGTAQEAEERVEARPLAPSVATPESCEGASTLQANPHGKRFETPKITIEEDGRVRVDSPDGPVWIRQCYTPGGTIGATASGQTPVPPGSAATASNIPYPGCLVCHSQIENAMQHMAGLNLDCTFCHGGNPIATLKHTAHVQSDGSVDYGKGVPPLDQDLEYQRFVNPSNLRVVDHACGLCHGSVVSSIKKSMMATTAGHYAGGLYQNGVQPTKTPIYSTFAVTDDDGVVPTERGAVQSLIDILIYDPTQPQDEVATHYAAVPSQACARCHLWSRGKGYRGAADQDGVYRADGCAACHMLYANDGLSQSADTAIDHTIPGYPRQHIITRQVPTEQCLHCHHRGARIGLSFTGRAQMPPRLPSGPGVPGTTDERFNGNYHYTVADENPQDIHNELGLHCIDCHVSSEIMGDDNIWGHMDQATKIECRTCHGLPGVAPTLKDNDGYDMPNMVADAQGNVTLTSKITGATHTPPLLTDFLDPLSPNYNPTAHASMDANHLKVDGGLECYACHSSWVPNCYGCHFERDETQLGLNLMTNMMEVGKVTTNNKIFESVRNFSIGPNSEGRVAPYLVACQPMADVTAPDGSKIMEYKMPTTQNGLSGLAMNPVQPHTVRSVGEVRTCAECHRSPPTLGFGTGNYSIGRNQVFAAGASGVQRFDRKASASQPPLLGDLPLAAYAEAIASVPNVIEGTADFLYVAEGAAGIEVFDLTAGTPGAPVHTISGIHALDVSRVARYLYVVDQGVGVKIYDTQDPTTSTLVSSVSVPNARRVVPFGIHLFVAAGSDGLVVIDIADHTSASVVGALPTINARDVRLYSHFQGGKDFAVRAYVADPGYGVRVVDLLPDFESPQLVAGLPLLGATGLDTYTRYVDASATLPSLEHDYLYVAAGVAGLHIFDITQPDAIVEVSQVTSLGGNVVDVDVCSDLAPPGVDDFAYLANTTFGLQVVDVTNPTAPVSLGTAPGAAGTTRVFAEVQQMDRFLDEQGNTLKENSHPFTDTFSRADIVRLLSVSIP